jgi:Flp pilus assembly pilin Flp
MMKALHRLFSEETGNFLIEHAFVTALVSIIAAGVWGFTSHYSTQVQDIFNNIFQALP